MILGAVDECGLKFDVPRIKKSSQEHQNTFDGMTYPSIVARPVGEKGVRL